MMDSFPFFYETENNIFSKWVKYRILYESAIPTSLLRDVYIISFLCIIFFFLSFCTFSSQSQTSNFKANVYFNLGVQRILFTWMKLCKM